jgi:hypothetical protein
MSASEICPVDSTESPQLPVVPDAPRDPSSDSNTYAEGESGPNDRGAASTTTLSTNQAGAQVCDGGCLRVTRVYQCVQCDGAFCNECWDKQFPHRPGKVGADGLPHEKTDMEVVERLRETLDTQDRTPEEQQKLHKEDEDTTWFGIARDDANMPIFQDYGRFAAILAEPQIIRRKNRYPQLVSFIGQTGMR